MHFPIVNLIVVSLIAGGIVTAPALQGVLGFPGREVFLIGQSSSKRTKLFLEEQKGVDSRPVGLPALKVMFDGKDIFGNFSLCSPSGKDDDYYLIKWDGSWKNSLVGGKSILDCNDISRDSMGEKLMKLNVKPASGDVSTELLKEIDLKNCKIEALSEEIDKTFKLTCGEVWAQSRNSNKKVEIFILNLDYI